ncbi:MAG TPA: hypothetical protein VKA54_01195, partial [Gemmatimonadaceae bacterium]|nr:hypothetical protein [Gemmatimonadaceae bacterium]
MAVLVRIMPVAALLVATASSLTAQAAPAQQSAQAAQPVCEATQPGGSMGARANLNLQLALKDQQAKNAP